MAIKKIAFFVIVIAAVFVINNLVHSIYDLWQKKDLITKTQKELQEEKKEHEELKSKLQEVNKQQFVEEQARNKLFLGKSGEGIILMPTQQLQTSPSVSPQPKDTRPNWKKWWETFFTTTP